MRSGIVPGSPDINKINDLPWLALPFQPTETQGNLKALASVSPNLRGLV